MVGSALLRRRQTLEYYGFTGDVGAACAFVLAIRRAASTKVADTNRINRFARGDRGAEELETITPSASIKLEIFSQLAPLPINRVPLAQPLLVQVFWIGATSSWPTKSQRLPTALNRVLNSGGEIRGAQGRACFAAHRLRF